MAFEELIAMVEEAKQEKERQMFEPPTSCPIDGEPLTIMPDGTRHCKLGNYTWPQGA